jgi:CDP-diacylglycerol--glycerol-3-phosphate 3-phosphatidyltransferase
VARSPLTFRRLSGLDRSGPAPPETRRDAPWRPWTIPNAIGFLRLLLIPVFVLLALRSEDGTDPLPAVLFALIAWGDYADGIAARVTGQYSRLGALMDPFIDRLLVVAGVVVVWNFNSLPRWALVVLALRELAMLVLAELALRRGAEAQVNWPGRIAVWPIMSALMAALLGWEMVGEMLLYVGLVFALWATALYVRDVPRKLSTSG